MSGLERVIGPRATPVGDSVEIRCDGNGEFDELLAKGAAIHIERMNAAAWWIGIDAADGAHWAVWIGAENQRAKFYVRVEEDKIGGREFLAGSAFASKGKP